MAKPGYIPTADDLAKLAQAKAAGRKYFLPKYFSYRDITDKYEIRAVTKSEQKRGFPFMMEIFKATDENIREGMAYVVRQRVSLGLMTMPEASAYYASYSPLMGKTPINEKTTTETITLDKITEHQFKELQDYLNESGIKYIIHSNK